LYISPKLKSFPPLLIGGGQENGYRSGTEAMPAILGFGAAAGAMSKTFREDIIQEKALIDGLVEKLSSFAGVEINGCHEAPHVLNLSIPGVPTQNIINILQDADICVSAGSACAKGHRSHTLTAMGLSPERMDSSFRVSICKDTTEAELDALLSGIRQILDWKGRKSN
jgi:cysteine desulfurase